MGKLLNLKGRLALEESDPIRGNLEAKRAKGQNSVGASVGHFPNVSSPEYLEPRKRLTEAPTATPRPTLSNISSDTQGNPSETLNSSLLATIKREWIHQLRATKIIKGKAIYKKILEPISLDEIREIEEKVRKELYG